MRSIKYVFFPYISLKLNVLLFLLVLLFALQSLKSEERRKREQEKEEEQMRKEKEEEHQKWADRKAESKCHKRGKLGHYRKECRNIAHPRRRQHQQPVYNFQGPCKFFINK